MLHMLNGYPQNDGMQKKPSRQIVAESLERIKAQKGFRSHNALGKKAKVATSHVRRISIQEIGASIDVLDKLANALGIHTFELLCDGEEIRKAALERHLGGAAGPDLSPKQDEPPQFDKEKEGPKKPGKKQGAGEPRAAENL